MKEQRHGAQDPVVAGAQRLGCDVLRLAGALVEAHHPAAVDDVRVERVGGDVGVLVGADADPVAKRDLAAVAAAGGADGAALLLAAVDPVGKLVVGRDVVELGRGLVVPGAPGAAAVDRDVGALIGHEEHDLGMERVDPDAVVVVTAGRALDRSPGLAGVVRLVGGDVAGRRRRSGFSGMDSDLTESLRHGPMHVDSPC